MVSSGSSYRAHKLRLYSSPEHTTHARTLTLPSYTRTRPPRVALLPTLPTHVPPLTSRPPTSRPRVEVGTCERRVIRAQQHAVRRGVAIAACVAEPASREEAAVLCVEVGADEGGWGLRGGCRGCYVGQIPGVVGDQVG